ncbi:MAG: type II toxin-antitoxin system VapC family toxin [Reyranella sp.]
MIVLDTDVVSELMRRVPDPRVMAWVAEQPMAGVFTTTLTQAEIFYGLALLPRGRRRDDLLTAARPMFDVDLAGRVLPFDADAALVYPEIAAGRKQGGKPISQIDALIAAIVLSRGARLATRNVRDFADCGIVVVDPWAES